MVTRTFSSYTYGFSCNSKYDDERVVNAPQNQNINCPLCLYLLCKPATLSQCGHTFCRSCIAQWFCIFRNCPLCRKRGNFVDFQDPPPELLEAMDSLKIRCSQTGCNAELTIAEMEKHEQKCPRQFHNTPCFTSADVAENGETAVFNDNVRVELTDTHTAYECTGRNTNEKYMTKISDSMDVTPREEFSGGHQKTHNQRHYMEIDTNLVHRIVKQTTFRLFNREEWKMLMFGNSILESDSKARAFWKVMTNEVNNAYVKLNDELGQKSNDLQRLRAVEFLTRRLLMKWEQLIRRRSLLTKVAIKYKRLPANGFLRLTGSFSTS